ncbi:MAG: hypothetical protein R3F04_16745 [Lysobacteraceae bacterium]
MPEAGLIFERDRTWLCVGDPLVMVADQARFPSVLTTLGPWSAQAMIEYLDQDHPDLQPTAAEQWAALLGSGRFVEQLRFAGRAV